MGASFSCLLGEVVTLNNHGFGTAHGAIIGHVVNYNGTSADVYIIAYPDITYDDGARTDAHIVADGRATITPITNGHQLVDHAVFTHLTGANNSAETVLDI